MSHRVVWTVPMDHPAFAGHFPGRPILPGVVLLDHVLHHLPADVAAAGNCEISSAKFVSPVGPGETIDIAYTAATPGKVRFDIDVDGRRVATGVISGVEDA